MRAYRDLIAVMAIAFVLRLLAWRIQGPGNLDELIGLHLLSRPFFESFGLVAQSGQQPLYHTVMWIWSGITGGSLFAARLLSVLLGTGSVMAVWLLAREVAGRREAVVAALLVAVSPAFVLGSVEAQTYSLVVALVALATWAYMRAGRLGCTYESLVPWGALSGAAMLADSSAFLPVAVLVGWVGMKASGQARKCFLRASLVGAAPFVVWTAVNLSAGIRRLAADTDFGIGNLLKALLTMPGNLFAAADGWPLALLATAVIVGAIWLSLRPSASESMGGALRLFALSAAVPIVILSVGGFTSAKHYLVALPALAVLAAIGFVKAADSVPEKRRHQAAFAAAGLVMLLLVPPLLDTVGSRRVGWNEAMQFIQNREQYGDMIFAEWFTSELPISQSYSGDLSVRSGYAQDAALSFSERLVMHAEAFEASELMLSRMESDVAAAQRVFLVTGAVKPSENQVQGWFLSNGWTMEEVWTKKDFNASVILFCRDGAVTWAGAPKRR